MLTHSKNVLKTVLATQSSTKKCTQNQSIVTIQNNRLKLSKSLQTTLYQTDFQSGKFAS